jgi:hypothetical protein
MLSKKKTNRYTMGTQGRTVAGHGRKDGQAVVEMRDDSGTHRLRSVRSARPTPTELDNVK